MAAEVSSSLTSGDTGLNSWPDKYMYVHIVVNLMLRKLNNFAKVSGKSCHWPHCVIKFPRMLISYVKLDHT